MSETVNFDKRLAREAAMSLYYERTIRGEPVNDSTTLIDFEDVLDRARLNEDNLKYIDCAMEIYEEHIDDIDASIRSHLNRWTIDRISKVNLSILRLAVAEMKYMGDITSCYTTSVSVSDEKGNILYDRRIPLKVGDSKRGLRQSEMVFQHVKNLGTLFPSGFTDIKGVASSTRPRPQEGSYMPVFCVSESYGKALS